MGITAKIAGTSGDVIDTLKRSGKTGIVSYSIDLIPRKFQVIPFMNDTFGSAMNQNIAFTGTPLKIHDGIDTSLWTASALSGTWVFNSTVQSNGGDNSIDARGTQNDTEALFSLPSGSAPEFANYTAVTGFIYLTGFPASGVKDIEMRFRVTASDIGNTVNLNDYIDTSLLNAWQKFSIPKSDFGLDEDLFNEIVIRTVSTGGGAAPDYFLDDIQIEETGSPAVFKASPPTGKVARITSVRFCFADAVSIALVSGTVPGISYNKFLGVDQLSIGITVQRLLNGAVDFTAVFKNISDMMLAGHNIVSMGDDGNNSFITTEITFDTELVLTDRDGDFISISINDNMSGLLDMRAIAIGSIDLPIEGNGG